MLSWVPLDPPYLFAMGGLNLTGGLYTLLVSLLAGLACGLVPVLQSSGRSVVGVLRSGRGTTGTRGSRRFGQALVMGELTLSTALLIAALLVVKSFVALQSVDQGYRTDTVLTATIDLSGDGLDESSQRVAAVERVLASLAQLEGAETVGVTTNLPAGSGHRRLSLIAEGRAYQPGEDVDATVHGVAGDYLATLEIPLLDGRAFSDSEKREGGAVALVSRGLATELWGRENPLGRQLRQVLMAEDAWMRVVGVVGDVDYGRDLTRIGTVPETQLYIPYPELASSEVIAVVGSRRAPQDLAGAARQVLATAVPGIPVEAVDIETALFRVQWVRRFFGNQLAVYAILASAIAALGLYGLMSNVAGGRRHELAVRMALGARRFDLIRLMLRDAFLLIGAGIGGGVLLAFWGTRFGAAMLPEVSARDPIVFGSIALLLPFIAMVAAFLPASRASLLDPNWALHAD